MQTLSNESPHRRSLASAATIEHRLQYDGYVPWEESTATDHSYRQALNRQDLTSSPVFDPDSSPIIIKDSLAVHPRRFRSTKHAVGGNINEIHGTLHACLQVGLFERAASLVRRLGEIYKPDAPGLLDAHNQYVAELSRRIVRNKDQQLLQHLQHWFQVDLVDAGVRADQTTYAMMIHASLERTDGRKDRTVRRYFHLAKEAGLTKETKEVLSVIGLGDPGLNAYLLTQPDAPLVDTIEAEVTMPETDVDQPTRETDEVRGAEQKGVGLLTLKKSLSIFSNSRASDGKDLSPTERQSLLEINTVNAAVDRWRAEDAHLKSIGVNSGLSTSTIGAMMWKWHEKLVPLIKDDIRRANEAEHKEKRSKSDEDLLVWAPCLQSLSPEKISAIAILTAMRVASTDAMDERGVRIHHVVYAIGEGIQNESKAEIVRKNNKDKHWRRRQAILKTRPKNDSLAKLIRSSRLKEYDQLHWSAGHMVKLGAALLAHLMEIAKVTVSKEDPKTGLEVQAQHPVFFHTFQYVGGKRVGVVRLNSVVTELLAKVPVVSALAKYLPMVCEPKPWVGFSEGGFLEYPVPVVRIVSGDKQSKRYAITAAENGDMDQVFAGLDVLAKTPWVINRFVFGTMLEAWNSGQAIAKIPAETIPIDLPPEPAASDSPSKRSKWRKRMREIENHRSGLRSQRCFQNFQLEVARAYLNDKFYFPHNCDFRGRAYPMAPFLNHMGADNARGLLMFARGRELTSDGLWWLKIHLANVYGYDKASFAERLEFTENHLPDIRDSVNKPLDGERWWLKAEDPWQCLAACKELKNALDLSDPSKYISQLAIHQDGTCNGLQHYAALGGDVAGAQQVNLEPGQRPSDIYTGVAELVKAEIAKDAIQGSELAKALDGKVTRKIVKQTVMTNVYGVTFTGAKRQVRKQLDDLLVDFPDTHQVSVRTAAPYITRKIFASLSTMFNGAHDIQHWLTNCAGRISESLAPEQVDHVENMAKGEYPQTIYKKKPVKGQGESERTDFKTTVIWTTPMKMPVVQPYRKKSERRIDTNLQMVTIVDRSAADPVHKAKQIQAFPPNFIHSLDATHMFLTALKCHEVGLTFAAIHDSFWTHAGDVNTMNRIIRDAFIRMHSEDIIGRLSAEFQTRYKGYMQLATVSVNTAVGQQIMAWRRQRTRELRAADTGKKIAQNSEAVKWDELLHERRRLNLLASEDSKEREEGEQMNSAGKIFDEAADERNLAPVTADSATIGLAQSTRDAKLKANQQLDVGDMDNASPLEPVDDEDVAGTAEDDVEVFEEKGPAGEADEDLLDDEDEEIESPAELKTKAKAHSYRKTWVWLPLTFPPVPKKGDFDVKRLKDSQYFFS